MSAQNFAITFGAGESTRLPAGRYFFVRTAASVINIETEGNAGSPVRFTGVGAGSKFGPVAEGEGWRFLRVTSPGAQNVEIIVSDDGNFEVASAVTISGVAAVQEQPASALANTAVVACGNAAQTAVVAANLSRRRVTLSVASNVATGSAVFVRTAGGANNLMELQAGVLYEFKGTYALDVRNDSGAAINVMIFEES